MTKRDGRFDNGNLQFWCKKTQKSLIEVTGQFDIDKIGVGFRMFNQQAEKGNRVTSSIDFYFDMAAMEVLCRDILSGNIAKMITASKKATQESGSKYPKPVREFKGGSKKTMKARILTISAGSSQPFIITAYDGPAKINETTGGVVPDYKYNEAEQRIMIGLSGDDLKQFAVMGLRAIDFYYDHYFGRIDPDRDRR